MNVETTSEQPTTVERKTHPPLVSSALFGVIYCDPPWRYDFAACEETSIEKHYPTMATEEICALKVPAEKNCVLYMWATAPKLLDAIAVMNAWGFQYKTHAIWDKQRSGMGYWFRGQHELLMVATRGKVSPPAPELRTSSLLSYPRGKHSSKPDKVRELIAAWFPVSRKLEMFARPWTEMWPKLEGWETWGNELPNDVAMTPNAPHEPRRE